jgi:hypothetical protein
VNHGSRGDDGHTRADPRAGDPRAVQTAADVRRLLSEQITQLTANPDLDPLRKARQVAQLAQVALRAIEQETLEARLEALEAALRLQKDARTLKETSP